MKSRSRPAQFTRDPLVRGSLGLFAVILAVLLFLPGCASTRKAGGSSLSDALDVAAENARREADDRDDDEEDGDDDVILYAAREIFGGGRRSHHHDRGCYRHGHARCGYDDDSGDVSFDPTLYLGATLDGVHRGEDDALAGGGGVSVRGGMLFPGSDDRFGLEGELSLGWADAGYETRHGMNDVFELTAGLAGRYYFTPSHVAAGPYALAGVRGGAVFWDYAAPVLVDEYGWVSEVASDRLGTWSPYMGMGVSFLRDKPVQLDLGVVTGLQFFNGYTYEGFRNDVFDTTPYTQVRVGFTGTFR